MKALIFPALLLLPALLQAQTPDANGSSGRPGDNFSLQGSLDLFSRSKDLSHFEKAINDPDEHVNNLDLNNDGKVDYIRVVDHKEGDAHAIILEDPVSGNESQDVAVIQIEKTGANTAQARVVGDETLYGPGVSYERTTAKNASTTAVVVDVWEWPSVRYVYGPSYVVWASPWYWGYYPYWYRPWRPYPVHVYYGYTYRYRPYYRPVHTTVYRQADVIYVRNRHTSPTVVQRVRPENGQPRTQEQKSVPAGNAGKQEASQVTPGQGQKAAATQESKTKKDPRSVRRAARKAQRGKKGGM